MSASGSGGGGGLRKPGALRGKLKAPKRIGHELSAEEMWNRLSHAVGEVQNHKASTLRYEEHYRYAYNLVLSHQGHMLYEGVKSKIVEHLSRQCRERLVPVFPPGGLSGLPPEIVLPPALAENPPQQNGNFAAASSTATAFSDKDRHAAQSSTSAPSGIYDTAEGGAGPSVGTGLGDKTDAAVKSQNTERLLKAIKAIWDDHCASMASLRLLLTYVDRVYVSQHPVMPIWDLGLELFRDTVLESRKYAIGTHLYAALLMQIQLERQGQVINRSLIKANIDMLVALTHALPGRMSSSIASRPTVYKHAFEPAFLRTSSLFYRSEAQRLLESTDAKSYLRHVERRFIEEEGRVAVFLAPTTDASLRSRMETFLLENHLQTIVNMPGSGVHSMLDEDLKDDLRRLYKLFWRVQPNGPVELKSGLKAYIAKVGKSINEGVGEGNKGSTLANGNHVGPDGEGDGEQVKTGAQSGNATTPPTASALKWVEDVLAFKNKFDDILAVAFESDKSIETVLNEAFESFINVNQRAAEFISLFIDENLKKGLKGKTEEEVEEALNRTIVVFRFLHEKDLFERHYKSHLAKRLLHGRSVSDDAERGMMAKLKIECGHGYVQKLQGMLNDVKVSEETAAAFTEYLRKASRPMPFDLSVSVLTSTYWPIASAQQPCVMPPSMMSARQAFENYYQSRHSGRLLNWHPNLGSADVRVSFKSRKHELNVSTYALVILLLFEDGDSSLSYVSIKQNTNIPDADLKRNLQSLACAKYKILLKEPKGREVGDSDVFTFNEGFTCPLARIKIATVAARVESSTERKETNEKIEEERKNQIEACIVRVMKDRKRLSHNELINEVIKQLLGRFGPDPLVVKKRIESLIDREYLERDGEQRNVYNYLA